MAINDQQMWETCFDFIYDSLTMGPAGVGGGASYRATPAHSILQLQIPGLEIQPDLYANEWTPTNPNGSTAASENFANRIDFIPNMGIKYDGSNQGSIEKLYGEEIVRANVKPLPEDPAKKAAFDAAFALLNVDGTDYDNDGKPITVKVQSPMYRNYQVKQAAYDAAVQSYMTAYLQYDLSKPADQRSWAILAPRLISPVNLAWQDLQTAQPGRIEAAINTIGQDQQSNLASRFSRARAQFDQSKRAGLSDPTATWHWSQANPGNWFAASVPGSAITISSDKQYKSASSSFSSWGGGGGLDLGFFSIGGSASHSSSRQSFTSDSSNLKISFQMRRVEIRRPWFDPTLLSLHGWSIAGRSPGAYSNGATKMTNGGIFPLYPTAFIVAYNIVIHGEWGHNDMTVITSNTSGGGGVSIGPFSFGGSGSSSSSSSHSTATFDGKTLTSSALQIIGWVSQVVPASPPAQ